jgi:hypothetical protein
MYYSYSYDPSQKVSMKLLLMYLRNKKINAKD